VHEAFLTKVDTGCHHSVAGFQDPVARDAAVTPMAAMAANTVSFCDPARLASSVEVPSSGVVLLAGC